MPTTSTRRPSHASPLVRLGVLLLIGALGTAGCTARTEPNPPWAHHTHGPTPGPTPDEILDPTPSPAPPDPEPAPAPEPDPAPGPPTPPVAPDDARDATQADAAFWQAYADGDAATACDQAVGLTSDGYLTELDATQRDACVAWLGSLPAAGTSLTVDLAVVQGDVAMVPVSGVVCGVQSPTADTCGAVPDLTPDMPTAGSPDEFEQSLADVVARWADGAAGWAPDVLVRIDGTWQEVLPLGEPSSGATTAPDTSDDQDGTPWTPRDPDETCPSGGCGALPGLPPFVDGGGLSFNP